MRGNKLFILAGFVFILTCIVLFINPMMARAYGYDTDNLLTNDTPNDETGWTLTNCNYNNGTYGGEFKGASNSAMYAKQTFTFSARDIYRINNGEIQVSASGYFWAQPSCTMNAYVKATFYNASNVSTGSNSATYDTYKISTHNELVSFSDYTVPAGTTSLLFTAKNDDSLVGTYPSFRKFSLTVSDVVAPTYVSITPVTTPAKFKVGSVIRYRVTFSEPVTVTTQGALKYKVGTQSFTNGAYATQSADGTKLYYDITLPDTTTPGDNLAVMITGLLGLSVTDDAGNVCKNIPATVSISDGTIVDNRPPENTSFSTTASTDAFYKAGDVIEFAATFHEYITVTGAPKIRTSNGKYATYVSKTTSATKVANFSYTIVTGDDLANIAITSVSLAGIEDDMGNLAIDAASYDINSQDTFMSTKNVSIDTTPPTTTFNNLGTGWLKSQSVILTPDDNISGVDEMYSKWTAAGATPTFPTSPNVDLVTNKVINPTTSGVYELHIKILDKAGNVATVKSPYTYSFDFTTPGITATPTLIAGTTVVTAVPTSATDAHSGISTFTYAWVSAGGITTLSGNGLVSVPLPTTDGTYTLTLTATDAVGNVKTSTLTGLDIDAIAPVVNFTPTEGTVYKKSYTVNFTVADSKAGVDKYYYVFTTTATKPASGSASWILTSATALTTPNGVSGIYYLHVKALDKKGNESITSTNGFNVDNVAPAVSINQNGNAGNIGKVSYTITVTISDATTISADMVKQYAVSASTTCPALLTDFTGSVLTVDNLDQNKYLYIVATDSAGNINTFKSNIFTADILAPTGTITRATTYSTNVSNVIVNISAADNYSASNYIMMQMKMDMTELSWESYSTQKQMTLPAVEGEHIVSVRFKDVCGNISNYYPVPINYDISAPQINFTYSLNTLTNQDVLVSATATDTVSPCTFDTVSSRVFTANGSFEFVAKDEAGNTTRSTASVTCIDKTNPTVTFTSNQFDGKKYKAGSVKIEANDANGIDSLKYAVVKNGDAAGSFTTLENGQTIDVSGLDGTYTVHVIAMDKAGNNPEIASPTLLFDNTAPIATVTYFPGTATAQNVNATLSFNETASITNGPSTSHTFTANGSYIYEFMDEAGNTGSTTATVSWIDKSLPMASVMILKENGGALGDSEWTNSDTTVSLTPPEGVTISEVKFNDVLVEDAQSISTLGENQFKVSDYGILSFTLTKTSTALSYTDQAVIQIDKVAPSITDVVRSNSQWTNQNVTVTIVGADNRCEITYPEGYSHTYTENGSFDFIVIDAAGNIKTETITVSNIDKTMPVATVTYSVSGHEYDITKPTKENITATIDFGSDGSPVTVKNNNGSKSYMFADNGSFTFIFADSTGNESSQTVTIDKIDRIAPTGYVIYSNSGWTNAAVTATLVAVDDMGAATVSGGQPDTYVFADNGTYTFTFEDIAGNTATATANVSKIDTTPPTLTYTLSTTDVTMFSVTAMVEADEPVTIENNGGYFAKLFDTNGNFTFNAKDRAGNTSSLLVSVANINKDPTPVKLTYSTTKATKDDVFVTILPVDDVSLIYVTNNDGQNIRKFTKNGTFTFTYKNAIGVEGTITATVSNIDKEVPIINISYSRDTVSQQNVVVTMTANEDVVFPNIAQDGKYTFTQNMRIQIPVYDKVNNVTLVTLETNLIDKTSPVINMTKVYDMIEMGALFNPLAGVTVTDDNGLDGAVVVSGAPANTTVGSYVITYTAKDQAGNTSVMYKYLTVYDPNQFHVVINGRLVGQEQITLETLDIVIEAMKSVGGITIKVLPGRKSMGSFKADEDLSTPSSSLQNLGYYTIYVMDAERNAQLLNIFVTE